MNKHKHYDLILWWAEDTANNIVQCKLKNKKWVDCIDNQPSWDQTCEYRKKPSTNRKITYVCPVCAASLEVKE